MISCTDMQSFDRILVSKQMILLLRIGIISQRVLTLNDTGLWGFAIFSL